MHANRYLAHDSEQEIFQQTSPFVTQTKNMLCLYIGSSMTFTY